MRVRESESEGGGECWGEDGGMVCSVETLLHSGT